MRGETLLGEGLVFGAGAAVVGVRVDGDATARGEESGDLYVLGIHQFDEVFHDFVDAILMEIPMVAETEQVQFQTLALDHPHVRNITDPDLGKVRLSRDRTQAREFRAVEPHPIVVALVLVDERLQNLRSVVTFIFSLLSEGLKALQFSSFRHNMIAIYSTEKSYLAPKETLFAPPIQEYTHEYSRIRQQGLYLINFEWIVRNIIVVGVNSLMCLHLSDNP